MKRIQFAIVAAVVATLFSTSAFAYGAVAIGKTKTALTFGASTDASTAKAASRQALTQCKSGNAPSAARSACRIVKNFSGQCVAAATASKPNTVLFGVGVGNDMKSAKAQAIKSCKEVAGRANTCRIVGSDCD